MENVTGVFEIHVFVEPLDPPPDRVDAFRAACTGAQPPMKALLLELDYVGKGYVGVLQSSRYVEGDTQLACDAAHTDAEVLRAAGFTVIREKVEALASNSGVPRDAKEAQSQQDRYFEFHLLIDGKDKPLSDDDMRGLRDLSTEFTSIFTRPVPLSYNALKPSQRFLNLRARSCGIEEAMHPVDALAAAIVERGLVVKKTISEYICSDTNRGVDIGWLEPTWVFVTGNEDKHREAEAILGQPLERQPMDLPELQLPATRCVALSKAHTAFMLLKGSKPVIVEDSGFEMLGLGGFPGPYIKHWEQLGGLASICRAADGLADRRAVAVCVLGVCDFSLASARVFEGRVSGQIAKEPRGTNGFGWDQIFIPDGDTRTFAEMSDAEKSAISHRRRAWDAFARR